MNIKTIAVSKINPAPYNPRKDLKPDDPQYKQLLQSIEEFGCIQPLIWNRRTSNLVGGHQRFKVLLAQGAKQIEVSVVNLPLEKEKALNIALNKISGQWDDKKLTELLDELVKTPDIDVELTGFELPDVEQMIADLVVNDSNDTENFDLDAELNRQGKIITKPGDLICLGSHRLLCGDLTKSKDMDRLMGDHRARLLIADVPYNVNYTGNNRPKSPNKKQRGKQSDSKPAWDKIVADHLSPSKYTAWFNQFTAAVNDALTPGAAFYIWNGHANFGLMHTILTANNLKPSSVLTWAKESFAPGFGDYNEQTEFCLYGWKRGARHQWFGPKNASTLWQVRRDRTCLYKHPTQKALELVERAIRNSSRIDDIVLDPCLGSGTTLIAAARLGRSCYGLEIEPKYCDVIVRRFIALAGKKAVTPDIARRYKVTPTKEVA